MEEVVAKTVDLSSLTHGMNSGRSPIYKVDAEDAYEYSAVEPTTSNDGLDNLNENYNYPFVIYSLKLLSEPLSILQKLIAQVNLPEILVRVLL